MVSRLIGPMYPKTSCECSECPSIPRNQKWPGAEKTYDLRTNNLGLRHCNDLEKIGQCINVSQVGRDTEPQPWNGEKMKILNPNFGLQVQPGFFHPPDAACGDCPKKDCVVTAFDPRLISAPRGGFSQQLDRPPYSGEVRLKHIYDKDLDHYGQGYKNYQDIHAGQIMYYIDPDLEPTYNLPAFTIRSKVDAEVYQTPMGGLWPQYHKRPLTKDSRYLSPQEFTRMTVSHREDIMSKQYARYAREKFPI